MKKNKHDLHCLCPACIELQRQEEHTFLIQLCVLLAALALAASVLLALLWRWVNG